MTQSSFESDDEQSRNLRDSCDVDTQAESEARKVGGGQSCWSKGL